MDTNEPEADKKDLGPDIWFGDPIKSLGGNKVGGYLVRFGSPDQPDNSRWRDFFTKDTDFGTDEWPVKVPILFGHGLHPEVGRRRLGTGSLKMDDKGIFIEAVLKEHDEWARAVLQAMEHKSEVTGQPPLLWSSGALGHVVEREAVKSSDGKTAHHVLSWFIGEASLTPRPAEARCQAMPLKSLEMPDLKTVLGCGCTGERKSLAERTERITDDLEDLLAGYRQVKDAEVKVGRALSASRRTRLEEARRLIDELLTETMPRDAAEAGGDPEATGMGAEANSAPGKSMDLSAPAPTMPQEVLSLISDFNRLRLESIAQL